MEDPALLYQGMVTTDRRFTMQSGKRPAILLLLPGADDKKALKEGVRVLAKLIETIDGIRQQMVSDIPAENRANA